MWPAGQPKRSYRSRCRKAVSRSSRQSRLTTRRPSQTHSGLAAGPPKSFSASANSSIFFCASLASPACWPACRRLLIGALGKAAIGRGKQHHCAEGGGQNTHTGKTHGCSGFWGLAGRIVPLTCRAIRSALRRLPTRLFRGPIKAAAWRCRQDGKRGGSRKLRDCAAPATTAGRRSVLARGPAGTSWHRARSQDKRGGVVHGPGRTFMGIATALFALAASAIVAAWAWLGAAVQMPPSPLAAGEKLHCVSYAPFRGESEPVRARYSDRSPANRGGSGPAQADHGLRADLLGRSRARPDPRDRQAPRHEGAAGPVAVEPARI